jgi:SSS family solute:Na+ symporter
VVNPIGSTWIGLVFGLGFVLSFGCWTTNFAEVQCGLSARNLSAAQRTPLIAAYPKLLIPAVVVIPGMIALWKIKESPLLLGAGALGLATILTIVLF